MPWAPAIAAASQPARMTKDAIWVHCTSSAWVSELTMLAADLRARLAERVSGAASGIRFELGDVVQAAPPADAEPRCWRPTRSCLRAPTSWSRDVSDPVLRERIREAIELSLRRGS